MLSYCRYYFQVQFKIIKKSANMQAICKLNTFSMLDFRAHPYHVPRNGYCPHQNHYVPRHINNRYINSYHLCRTLVLFTLLPDKPHIRTTDTYVDPQGHIHNRSPPPPPSAFNIISSGGPIKRQTGLYISLCVVGGGCQNQRLARLKT